MAEEINKNLDAQEGAPQGVPPKKKRGKFLRIVLVGALISITVGVGVSLLFPDAPAEELSVSLGAPLISFFGLQVPSSAAYTWVLIGILTVIALIIRIFFVPKFKDVPTGLQNVLETIVEATQDFTKSHVHGISRILAPYVFTVGVFIVASSVTELFGFRPPTSDITVTFALSIITFLLINIFGITQNGFVGRLSQFFKPQPFMLPFKILSDVAVPVSLACRLFGNMLGGLIVIDLVYMALGNFAVGIPAVLGLYFNLFHPMIQTFIFLKLSLSFIGEAIE